MMRDVFVYADCYLLLAHSTRVTLFGRKCLTTKLRCMLN